MSSSIPKISKEQGAELANLHRDFSKKACLTGCSVAAASFLVIGALIVIFSASMCALIPGVNVIKDIILPGVLPGVFAILISIPFILLGVKYARAKAPVWDQIVKKVANLILEKYNDENKELTKEVKEEMTDFIRENFIDSTWIIEAKMKLVSEVKSYLEKEHGFPKPSDSSKDNKIKLQKAILEALDNSLKKKS